MHNILILQNARRRKKKKAASPCLCKHFTLLEPIRRQSGAARRNAQLVHLARPGVAGAHARVALEDLLLAQVGSDLVG